MASNSTDVRISKALSYLLRHSAEREGIQMRKDGFVKLDDLLNHRTLKNTTKEEVFKVVQNCNKQRFSIQTFDSEPFIRANQGHTLKNVEIDMIELDETASIKQCLHGTYYKAWPSIKQQGLSRMNRQHIHFSEDYPGSKDVISGMRGNCELAIFVNVKQVLKDGIRFFRSANNVILCPGDQEGFLKPKYFEKVVDLKKDKEYEDFLKN